MGLRVVAGVARPAEECAAHQYDGCIVARRTINFIAHAGLHIDVDLSGACIGRACDASLPGYFWCHLNE